MGKRQTKPRRVPQRVLLSDARNDAGLLRALARLGPGDVLVFRHYHLDRGPRTARFAALAKRARMRGVRVIGSRAVRGWRTDGSYGAPAEVAGRSGLKLATAHSLKEIAAAVRARADAVLLSPVFPTRSHPGARGLGAVRFLLMARHSPVPVIALGGMTRARAARLPVQGWAAIDGLA